MTRAPAQVVIDEVQKVPALLDEVHFIDTIAAKADLLSTQPEMGRKSPELGSGLRSFPVGAFVLFYRPTKGGIEVVRVLRGSRDIPTLF